MASNQVPSSRFVAWMKKFGMRPLARALGVSKATVYRWRNGASEPRSEALRKIGDLAAAEGVNLDWHDALGAMRERQ